MIKTITLILGNSDNKLTQVEWTRFCRDIDYEIRGQSTKVHFSAPSIGWNAYQNACWVFELDEMLLQVLRNHIEEVRKVYKQDSVALVYGDTEFI